MVVRASFAPAFPLKTPKARKAEFFQVFALPFAAASAVHGFHRVAFCFDCVLTSIFGIRCTQYCDECRCVAPKGVAEEGAEAGETVLIRSRWGADGVQAAARFNGPSGFGVVLDLGDTAKRKRERERERES